VKALVTGGARSGKTRHALSLAESLAPHRIYLATAEVRDAEMADRVGRHRAERGPSWQTIEEPLEVALRLDRPGAVVLLDCLTLWVSNLMEAERDLPMEFARLNAALAEVRNPVVVVTNEVGFGIVPDNALARRFRDASGTLAQGVAAVCDRVDLLVAGLPLRVKG